MRNRLLTLMSLACLVGSPVFSDDDDLEADWSGGDCSSDGGGNGSITLPDSGTVQAQLKIICDKKTGYTVTFSTPNAVTNTTANMKLVGAGTTTDTKILYSASMDISDFTDTGTILTNSLKLTGGSPSISVRFNASGNVVPNSSAKANIVKLNIGVSGYVAENKRAGSYVDTITAVVVFR